MEMKSQNGLLTFSSYQGKEDSYNIVKIETEKLDSNISPSAKAEFIMFYSNKLDEKLGGKENMALDLSQVNDVDSSGLSVILVLNKLNKNKYNKPISLLDCQPDVERMFFNSGLHVVFDKFSSKKYL